MSQTVKRADSFGKRRRLSLALMGPLSLAVAAAGLTSWAARDAQALVRPKSSLAWGACPDGGAAGMECASLQVPVDWAKPGGRRITLMVGRLRADGGTPADGSVLINFGGPGAPGIATMRARPELFAELRHRMDLITWDPRGYGEAFGGLSTGLPCAWTANRLPPLPRNQQEFDQIVASNRASADACRTKDPDLFDHMDSATQARDMDAIRRALGERQLNLLMQSYGGAFGQSYAHLFPQRVRTLLLDGTLNHSSGDWNRELDATALDNQRVMTRFFDWCDGEASCVLHGSDVRRIWQDLVAAADRNPVPAPAVNTSYDGRDLQILAIAKAGGFPTGGPSQWGVLAQAIRDAGRGDASGFAPPGRFPYPFLPTGYTECLDWPHAANQADMAATVRRLSEVAPYTGAASTMAINTLGCVGWPIPVTNPPRPLPKGLPPLLSAGNWREYDSAERAVQQVPGSGSIYHDGPGHTLYGANACATAHINRYLIDRQVPARDTIC